MTVCVVGLGKIGLPLAVQFAGKGRSVIGLDVDERVVNLVNSGTEPFSGEAELSTRLERVVGDRSLRATTDAADAVGSADVVVIVVPLVVGPDLSPDFTAIDAATTAVGSSLRPGTLVVYETTLPVHTTRERFSPRLAALSGLQVERDLFVCHSPERVYSGRIFADLRRYPKLVGGVGPSSAARAVTFYSEVLDFDDRPDLDLPNGVWNLGSAEAAEMAKLAETTYRNVNIAFANELAILSDAIGVDVAPIIAAANSQPYSHVHAPGVAVGGHCIPVYPHFLIAAGQPLPLVEEALQINGSMPGYVVGSLAHALGGLHGRRVVILGAAYRGGVKELAFSGVFPLARALAEAGAAGFVHDPLFTADELVMAGLTPYEVGSACDAAILQADHAVYGQWTPETLPGIRVLLDGRGSLDSARWPNVTFVRLGDGTRGPVKPSLASPALP